MSRPAHGLFRILTALSLLLCALFIYLWLYSYQTWDNLRWETPVGPAGFDRRGVQLLRGQLALYRTISPAGDIIEIDHKPFRRHGLIWDSFGKPPWPRARLGQTNLLGFAHRRRRSAGPFGQLYDHRLIVPFWFPTCLAAVLPLLALQRRQTSRRRKRQGRCVSCGYDLTGNMSGICPECGNTTEGATVWGASQGSGS